MDQIREGLKDGIDVSIYAKPEFKAAQMRVIRFGLQSNIDVTLYLNPSLDWKEMEKLD